MFTHKHVRAGQIGPISRIQTFSTSDKILCEKLGCLHVRNSDATIHFSPPNNLIPLLWVSANRASPAFLYFLQIKSV